MEVIKDWTPGECQLVPNQKKNQATEITKSYYSFGNEPETNPNSPTIIDDEG